MTLAHASPLDQVDLSRLPAKHRSAAASAVDVADALEALDVAGLPTIAEAHLLAIVERQQTSGQGVPISAAATVLHVTPRTIRKWIDGGVLEPLANSKPQQVSVASLGAALAAAHRIRALSHDGKLFALLLEELADRRTRADVGGRLEALKQQRWTAVSSDELDELLG